MPEEKHFIQIGVATQEADKMTQFTRRREMTADRTCLPGWGSAGKTQDENHSAQATQRVGGEPDQAWDRVGALRRGRLGAVLQDPREGREGRDVIAISVPARRPGCSPCLVSRQVHGSWGHSGGTAGPTRSQNSLVPLRAFTSVLRMMKKEKKMSKDARS
jgi:hypothetical protein